MEPDGPITALLEDQGARVAAVRVPAAQDLIEVADLKACVVVEDEPEVDVLDDTLGETGRATDLDDRHAARGHRGAARNDAELGDPRSQLRLPRWEDSRDRDVHPVDEGSAFHERDDLTASRDHVRRGRTVVERTGVLDVVTDLAHAAVGKNVTVAEDPRGRPGTDDRPTVPVVMFGWPTL